MKDIEIDADGILMVNIENTTQCENIVESLISLYKKHQFNKVIITSLVRCNHDITNYIKQYDVGKELVKYFRGYHIPIIVRGECHCFTHFTETVAVNRGLELEVQISN